MKLTNLNNIYNMKINRCISENSKLKFENNRLKQINSKHINNFKNIKSLLIINVKPIINK